MKKTKASVSTSLCIFSTVLLMGTAGAQTPESAGDAAPATTTVTEESKVAPDIKDAAPPAQGSAEPATDAAKLDAGPPLPSEIARRATSNPLLKVVNNGGQYVAVGARGHILLSADGVSWTQSHVPVDALLTSVTFVDSNDGWAVGHDAVILHTTDGGKTWKLQNRQPDLNKPLFDVCFLDASTGFAIGAYGLFLNTTDGGEHWQQMQAAELLDGEKHLNAMAKLGDGSLMIVGEAGLIGVSSDHGKTWKKTPSPYTSSLFAVIAAGDKGATIAGLRGSAFWSPDVVAGTWSKIATGSTQSLFGIAVLPGQRLGMVGLNGTLLVFDTDAKVHEVPIKDKAGNRQSETISWLTDAKDGSVIVVGDAGVQRLESIAN